MRNSTCLVGGKPGKSSGKTSGESRMIGMSLSFFYPDGYSVMRDKIDVCPLRRHLCAFMQEMMLHGAPLLSP